MILEESKELMHPNDFVHELTKEVDEHAAQQGYPEIWRNVLKDCTDEEVERVVIHRLTKGFYQEMYIRDIAMRTVEFAPDLKAQKALLQQVEDEHKHAIWVARELRKKGITPEETRPSLEVQCMWDGFYGITRNVNNFLTVLSALQLVVERGFGLQSTFGFAEAIVDKDPEVSELYLGKIRRDELFHTVQLPESLIHKHATTIEAQNEVRFGVKKGRVLMRLLEADVKNAKKTS